MLTNKKKLLAVLTLLTILSFVFASAAHSGVGNSTSHSSGSKSSGSSSKSGSSSSSKSGSSSSSSSSSSTSSSNSSNSSSSTGSSSGYTSGSPGTYTGSNSSTPAASKSAGLAAAAPALFIGLPLLVVLGGIIVLVIFLRKKKGQSGPLETAEDFDQKFEVDLTALKERDPDFNEDLFIAKINNIYVQLQESWESRDWKKVRPFESDELFNMHKRQLQEFIDSNTTNVVDDIAVLKTHIRDYREYGDIETLDVYLKARIRDYIIEDATKKVIEGNPQQEIIIEYILSMSRKKGILTRSGAGTTVNTCPNCGANISINAAGECEYCGSVVTSGDFDWVLTRLEVLSQS